MASPADNLPLNLGAFSKATELKRRLWFTMGALIIYRLGTYVPLPGIDPAVMAEIIKTQTKGMLGIFDVFSGGALRRMSVFALAITPYILASIIIQLFASVNPALEQLRKEGITGRIKLNQYTRYLTVAITALQAVTIATGLQSATSASGAPAVIADPLFFIFTTVVSLVGGTLFLVWLGEQINERGIGQGISLLIFAGIVAGLPGAIGNTLQLGRTGALSPFVIVFVGIGALAVIAFIVFIEQAQRRVLVQYPKRQHGNTVVGGEASHLPLKINTSGVIPPIFASTILLLPATLTSFSKGGGSGIMTTINALMGRGQPLYLILYSVLIVFFCFFYTAVAFNPAETADNLRKYGGYVPGIRPGKNTAEYLDFILTRLAAAGSAYLIIVCLIPEFLISHLSVPFYFGGTSLLIVVNVTLNTMQQIEAHLLAHQYEGLLKKTRLRRRE